MRASIAATRSSSSRTIGTCANASYARSASGGPRHRSRAARRLAAADAGSPSASAHTRALERSLASLASRCPFPLRVVDTEDDLDRRQSLLLSAATFAGVLGAMAAFPAAGTATLVKTMPIAIEIEQHGDGSRSF